MWKAFLLMQLSFDETRIEMKIIIMRTYTYFLMFQVALLAFVTITVGQEYDYQSAPRPAPPRVQPGYSGPTAPKPTPVPILKQINRYIIYISNKRFLSILY